MPKKYNLTVWFQCSLCIANLTFFVFTVTTTRETVEENHEEDHEENNEENHEEDNEGDDSADSGGDCEFSDYD